MAIKANIVIDQGTDFSAQIDVADSAGDPYDLTGHTVAAQMRKNYSSSTATSFTTSIVDPTVGGEISISLTNTETEDLEPGRYLYDVEITSDTGVKTRVVEGVATVTPGMTRT